MSESSNFMGVPAASTLARAQYRALDLLTGIGRFDHVRESLEAVGFTPADAAEAYALIKRASGSLDAVPATGVPAGRSVGAALRTLAEEGMAFFRCVRVTLGRRSPSLANAVFGDLDPSDAPVVLVGLLLDRLTALAADPRPEAVEACALLVRRRLGPDRQAELLLLVERATGQRPEPVLPSAAAEARAADVVAAQQALHLWWSEWSELARAAARNRGELITLGLARRRSARTTRPSSAAPPSTDETPETGALRATARAA